MGFRGCGEVPSTLTIRARILLTSKSFFELLFEKNNNELKSLLALVHWKSIFHNIIEHIIIPTDGRKA